MGRAALCWLALAVTAGPALAVCEPWPGEPEPLPTRSDESPLRSEWATLRARELAHAARRFEGSDDLRALQHWRHLLCIDPDHREALQRSVRLSPVKVHRPELRDEPFDASGTGTAWASLGAPIGVRTVERVAPEERSGDLFLAVRALGELVRQARFERALRSAAELRTLLATAARGSSRVGLVVETEVLAATAELALGREEEAIRSFRRALAVYPSLELDPSTTSPKVVRALDAARNGAAEEPTP